MRRKLGRDLLIDDMIQIQQMPKLMGDNRIDTRQRSHLWGGVVNENQRLVVPSQRNATNGTHPAGIRTGNQILFGSVEPTT